MDIKKQTALDLGIEIDFEYREPQKLLIPSVDMSIILGNAIDNAIEATHKLSDTSKKRIRLFVALKNDTVIITIKNPTISEIDPNNLTTEKEEREEGRGERERGREEVGRQEEVLSKCTRMKFMTF